MIFQSWTIEQWTLVIGVISATAALIGVVVGVINLGVRFRERAENYWVKLLVGKMPGQVSDGEGGFHEFGHISTVDVVVGNKGKETFFVKQVFLCNKTNERTVKISFGSRPIGNQSASLVYGFFPIHEFSLEPYRSKRSQTKITTLLREFDLRNPGKYGFFVRIELESGKTVHSKALSVPITAELIQQSQQLPE